MISGIESQTAQHTGGVQRQHRQGISQMRHSCMTGQEKCLSRHWTLEREKRVHHVMTEQGSNILCKRLK